jgi:hypothetical protein
MRAPPRPSLSIGVSTAEFRARPVCSSWRWRHANRLCQERLTRQAEPLFSANRICSQERRATCWLGEGHNGQCQSRPTSAAPPHASHDHATCPGSLTSATKATTFLSNDQRLEVDVPAGAVSASDLAAAATTSLVAGAGPQSWRSATKVDVPEPSSFGVQVRLQASPSHTSGPVCSGTDDILVCAVLPPRERG